ncbi:hypothetical protein AVEN_56887-1 [Araneus ventricosus]|uniref:Uncharacterized protein n=1 Tax=Araneus ventricosus TaxID=182803 RepID=A0A4Y2EUD3_ARAVE|nr:hypothetical protein AVEN_56887-1 [Araneus ventricosus]
MNTSSTPTGATPEPSSLNNPSHLTSCFVKQKKRFSRILELTKDFSWHHVKTSENPSDIISRGNIPQQLLDNSLWWNGPQFLQKVTVQLSDTNDIPTDDIYFHELKKESDKTSFKFGLYLFEFTFKHQ